MEPLTDGLSGFGPPDDWPIGRLFSIIARMSGPVMWRLVEQHGTSPAGFFLLRALTVQDGLRAGEAARQIMVTPATLTSVVSTLERNGHVERRRDPADRRAVRLHLTDSGRGVVHATVAEIGADLARLYAVDPADEPAVRRFLLGLLDRFRAYTDHDGDPTCPNPPN